ncbi:MAG: DAK2 domain-containing protein [Chloroflexi bacterium]|nr:DAK2 domain-containing protein [Chloroflexota bacterium]
MTQIQHPESFFQKHPPNQPLFDIDGWDLQVLIGAGYSWLKQHSHIVNALNVFPVPDGDTGTNMVLTMQSAWKEAVAKTSTEADEIAQAFALGAIRGARGNSGVILSQILRGFAEDLKDVSVIDAKHVARAMKQAKETAYKGVIKPVEGTILTVISEAADACEHAAALDPDLRFVLASTLAKAKQALDNTPNLLPVLKKAGVVDAGGQGLYYLLEGMLKYLEGVPIPMPDDVRADQQQVAVPQPDLDALHEEEWGYDIQFLIYGDHLDENQIREKLVEMGGESVVVGQAGPVVKVHVHNEDPGPFLSYGASLGYLDDIVLENMTLQTLRRKGEWRDTQTPVPTALPHPAAPTVPSIVEQKCSRVVAVASGEGLQQVFESLHVCAVVKGGQTMNPSTEELLAAVDSLPYDDVIILPNNKNVIMAARQVTHLTSKRVHIVETRSMPEGIAAMLAYHADADIEENLANMRAAAASVRTIEVTTAVRDAKFDGIQVHKGDIIALVDGELSCKSDNYEDAVIQAIPIADPEGEYELISIYYGADVSEEEAKALADRLGQEFPDYEIEMHKGGQPHYPYLISVE